MFKVNFKKVYVNFWTYFTSFSSASIVDFKKENFNRVLSLHRT